MTKGELVKELGKVLCSAKEAQVAVNTILDTIIKTVKNGENVALVGFGTFKLAKRTARKGRNPRTGETIKIKAAKVPRFSAGKAFKDAVKK